MIKRFCAPALVLLTLSLTGCFFDNPLTGQPSKDINTWLLGGWEYKDETGKAFRATVLPLTGSRYTVWFHAPGKTAKQARHWQFEAWISRVGASSFLTLECRKSGGEVPVDAFVFAHYQVIDQNHVIMRPLQLDSTPEITSYQLRTEVRRKLKDQSLLPATGTLWTRISEVYWQPGSDAEQPFQPLRFPLEQSER